MSSSTYAPLTDTELGLTAYAIPFTTSWTAPTSCSTLYIGSAGSDGIPDGLTVYDKKYGINVTSTASCLPTEVTKISATTAGAGTLGIPTIVTLLAPFNCPVSWYEAWTSVSVFQSATSVTFTACCPSQYGAMVSNDDGLSDLYACTSMTNMFSGLTYAYSTNSTYAITSIPHPTSNFAVTVTAYSVAGYNIATATSTSSSSSESEPESQSTSAGGDSLSSGAKAGIGIGVALGVIAVVSLLTLLYFHRRRKQRPTTQATAELEQQKAATELGGSAIIPPREIQSENDRSELRGDVAPVHEMQGSNARPVSPQELDAASYSTKETNASESRH